MAFRLPFQLPSVGQPAGAGLGLPGGAGLASMAAPASGDKPVARQLRLLGLAFGAALAIAAVAGLLELRQQRNGDALVAATGQARTLSQQIAKSVPLALQGNGAAFKELRVARDRMSAYATALAGGANLEGLSIPATPTPCGRRSPSPLRPGRNRPGTPPACSARKPA